MTTKYFDKYKFTSEENSINLYLNGYVKSKLQKDEVYDKFLTLLRDLKENPKDGFKWVEKYPSSHDLYPNTYSYDDLFLDFLFSQGLPEFINNASGSQLFLGDVALRIVYPGSKYMTWHRDTYQYSGKEPVGRFPAMHKIIFYPDLNNTKSNQIKLSPGSHRRVSKNRYLDRLLVHLFKQDTIQSSNDEVLFFESSLFHGPLNTTDEKGSYRLIYNFVNKSQLSQFEGREELHQKYIDRLSEMQSLS